MVGYSLITIRRGIILARRSACYNLLKSPEGDELEAICFDLIKDETSKIDNSEFEGYKNRFPIYHSQH